MRNRVRKYTNTWRNKKVTAYRHKDENQSLLRVHVGQNIMGERCKVREEKSLEKQLFNVTQEVEKKQGYLDQPPRCRPVTASSPAPSAKTLS